MKTERIDYGIVGESLAGVSAALALAESGNRVVLLNLDRDTDLIADLPRVQATSLGPSSSGMAFDERVQALLKRAGVERQATCHVTAVYREPDAIVECTDRRWMCKGIVFAPNGTEPGLSIEGSSALHGFGVSYSAAADAPFYASCRVAVYGDAPRAIEHAHVAARYASEVVVLLKGVSIDADPDLLRDLRSSSAIEFRETVSLQSLHAGDDRMLRRIDVHTRNGVVSIDLSALFVAQHLVPAMDIVRGETENGSIAFAGLAAGIQYWKHFALVSDGARRADTLGRSLVHSRQGRSPDDVALRREFTLMGQ